MPLLPKRLALPKQPRASQATRAITTDPQTTTDVPQTRTTQEQVAAASAVAERMSVPTLDASLDALVAVLVAGPDVKSVSDLAGKTIAIDDRYSEQSISRVRTAMAAAGALEVQLSKGQTTAINRLVGKEVPAAVVGLVSASAADSFPELARFRIFQVPLSPRSSRGQAVTGLSLGDSVPVTKCGPRSQKPNKNNAYFLRWCARRAVAFIAISMGCPSGLDHKVPIKVKGGFCECLSLSNTRVG